MMQANYSDSFTARLQRDPRPLRVRRGRVAGARKTDGLPADRSDAECAKPLASRRPSVLFLVIVALIVAATAALPRVWQRAANQPVGEELLLNAAERGDVNAVRTALDAGIPADGTGSGITALMLTSDADCARLLISRGAKHTGISSGVN